MNLSRREFLKLGGLYFASIASGLPPPTPTPPEYQRLLPQVETGVRNEAGAALYEKLFNLGLKYKDQGMYIYNLLWPEYSDGPFPFSDRVNWDSGFKLKIFSDQPARVISHPDAVCALPDETFHQIIHLMTRFGQGDEDNPPVTTDDLFALDDIVRKFKRGDYAQGLSVPPEIIIGIKGSPYACFLNTQDPEFGSNENLDPSQPSPCQATSFNKNLQVNDHFASLIVLSGGAYNNYKSKLEDDKGVERIVWPETRIEHELAVALFGILLTLDNGQTLPLTEERKKYLIKVFDQTRRYFLFNLLFKEFTPFFYPELPDPFSRKILDFWDKFDRWFPPDPNQQAVKTEGIIMSRR